MILTNEIQRDQRYRALGLEVIVAKELAAIRSVMQRATMSLSSPWPETLA